MRRNMEYATKGRRNGEIYNPCLNECLKVDWWVGKVKDKLLQNNKRYKGYGNLTFVFRFSAWNIIWPIQDWLVNFNTKYRTVIRRDHRTYFGSNFNKQKFVKYTHLTVMFLINIVYTLKILQHVTYICYTFENVFIIRIQTSEYILREESLYLYQSVTHLKI